MEVGERRGGEGGVMKEVGERRGGEGGVTKEVGERRDEGGGGGKYCWTLMEFQRHAHTHTHTHILPLAHLHMLTHRTLMKAPFTTTQSTSPSKMTNKSPVPLEPCTTTTP